MYGKKIGDTYLHKATKKKKYLYKIVIIHYQGYLSCQTHILRYMQTRIKNTAQSSYQM